MDVHTCKACPCGTPATPHCPCLHRKEDPSMRPEEARLPIPTLRYHFWGQGPDPDVTGGPDSPTRLFTVQQVSVGRHEGRLDVYVQGPMRKRDGSRGKHSRIVFLDLDAWQPEWVAALVKDAESRLRPAAPSTYENFQEDH